MIEKPVIAAIEQINVAMVKLDSVRCALACLQDGDLPNHMDGIIECLIVALRKARDDAKAGLVVISEAVKEKAAWTTETGARRVRTAGRQLSMCTKTIPIQLF